MLTRLYPLLFRIASGYPSTDGTNGFRAFRLAMLDDPNEKLALLAAILEDSIATVFRQTAMNRFEHAVHTARREAGE